ncbi:MAG: hypothetical protein H6566_27170 [Lewinellaceae bacterium]|nr:hypothetical protein [Lewinellaceae bacterium]
MQRSIPLQMKQPSRLIHLLFLLLILLTALYLYLSSPESALPLAAQMEEAIGINASREVYEEAISYAGKNLANELDIDLENYDISLEDYRTIVGTATRKFGNCQQYRLIPLETRPYSCFTCTSRPTVILSAGQTFKIGQTCGNKQSRYGSELPEPGLKYFIEFEGNIFEVMVAEYVKLMLFQQSIERKEIIRINQLSGLEMPLPPGNKILR